MAPVRPALACIALLLGACTATTGGRGTDASIRPPAPYVVLAPGGQAVARAIVTRRGCPSMLVDGKEQEMQPRAAPASVAARPGQARTAEFPVLVCELPIPPAAHAAAVDGASLPMPKGFVRRIVIVGDTGCRIKQADNAFQGCSDTSAWPFAAVADAAADARPDLVVHVGDYHYRESPCPPGERCAGSPWGYGFDAWDADLFEPARRLMAAAPWVVVRGNHEECARAGQGWFRFLDPAPFTQQRSCDSAADDPQGDYSAPYAVPLGGGWQLIVFDSARASQPGNPENPADAYRRTQYEAQMAEVARLAAAPGIHSIFVSHHPVLGFSVDKTGATHFGNPVLLAAARTHKGANVFPPGVEAALHGHVHIFQAIDFASDDPATIVAGHGGDKLDRDLPASVSATYDSAPGVQIDFAAHARGFGFLLLERTADGWLLRTERIDGSPSTVCTMIGRHMTCAGPAAVSRPG